MPVPILATLKDGWRREKTSLCSKTGIKMNVRNDSFVKRLIKNPASYLKTLLLAAIFLSNFGCATHDPLAGWTFRQFDDYAPASERHHFQLNKDIENDCQAFIAANHLDLESAITGFYEDGTGRHPVAFEADKGKDVWNYYLFYDKNNERIKVLKHYRGRYWNP